MALLAVAVLALLAGFGYTAFSGVVVVAQLDSGRAELLAAQSAISAGSPSLDPGHLGEAAARLQRAEQDFVDAGRRARGDPALGLVGGIRPAGYQVDATARLATIGADVSRAGEAAVAIALEAGRLKQEYAGKPLTPETLPAALTRAEGVAGRYAASARWIGEQLQAAHAERAAVSTGGLLPPLRAAYEQVDAALRQADNAFGRYQDVRRLLLDLLGIAVP